MQFVEIAGWLAGAITILLIQSLASSISPGSVEALSLLPLAFGVSVFIRHGGGRITTLGLFNLSLALFIGYGGWVSATDPFSPVSHGYLTLAIAGSFLAQLAITLLAWPAIDLPDHPAPTINDHDALWLSTIGAMTFLVCLYVFTWEEVTSGIAILFLEGASFCAIVVFAMGAFYREGARLFSVSGVVVVGAFFVYVELIHGGGAGRLRLVALACTLALLVSARFPQRAYKWVIVAGTPLAIFWLAVQRLSQQEAIEAGGSAGRTGLESMTGNVVTFAQLLEKQAGGEAPLAWGLNFLSAPVLVIPQRLLPFEKPEALGYELVKLLDPEKYGTGYSLASTLFGEWVFNFGVWGLVLVVPVMAWVLAFVDRRFRRSVDGLADHENSFMPVLVWILVAGSIGDLTWQGLHTLTARTLSRLPLAIAVGLIVQRRGIRSPRRRRSKATSP